MSVGAIATALGLAADHDLVLFIDDIASALETSTRTIERQLRAGPFPIPQLPKIDTRHRWSAVVVADWLRTNGEHVPTAKRGGALRLVGETRAHEKGRR